MGRQGVIVVGVTHITSLRGAPSHPLGSPLYGGLSTPPPKLTPATFLDLDVDIVFQTYDASITDTSISFRGEHDVYSFNHSKSVESIFVKWYDSDITLLSATKGVTGQWSHLKSRHAFQKDLADAFGLYLIGPRKPRTVMELIIHEIAATRYDRWKRLALNLKSPVPDGFRVYRGMHASLNNLDLISQTLLHWGNLHIPVSIPMKRAASFSLKESAALRFASDQSYGKPGLGVIFDADAPFFITLADKLVDDGRFVVPWWDQYEIIIGGRKNDFLATWPSRIKLVLHGKIYSHLDEAQFRSDFAAIFPTNFL